MSDVPILVINTGSSSLKLGIYVKEGNEEKLVLDGLADGIGKDAGTLTIKDANGRELRSEAMNFASQRQALSRAAEWITELYQEPIRAIGHRVVHGGPRLTAHQRITPEVLQELRDCVHFAPLHIPAALHLIEDAEARYPGVPQFACFDTAFHVTMPEVASRFALPGALFDDGIRRYGFHGLSYESIVRRLGDELPRRTVMAHLGNGASLAAVQDGRSVDTTMGLTPTGGIPMATRSGDLDPGVLLYLMRVKQMDADSLEELLNRESGMTALSGGSADMRDLQAAADEGDAKAELAIEAFCRAIAKVVASYAVVLGGLDLLTFSGGIGEHSALVRGRVCSQLGFLGVRVDERKNQAHEGMLSAQESGMRVLIVPSEEDRQIAVHCRALLSGS
jgi:acetate kinase